LKNFYLNNAETGLNHNGGSQIRPKKKTWPVAKTLSVGGYKIQKRRVFFSLIITLLIALLVNMDAVVTLIPQRPPLYLSLIEYQYPSITQSEIENFIKQRQYVPNYDASIYVLISEKVEIGSYIQFRINVVDNGILKLQKPYYYIFLVNPSGLVISSFPAWGMSLPTYLSYKFSPWNTEDHTKDFYKDCLRIEIDDNCYYIPRKTLIDGHGKYVYVSGGYLYWSTPSDILFRYKIRDDPSLIGRWRIYVFVYDEEYFDRSRQVLDSANFVNYMVDEFSVTSKSPPTMDFFYNVYWRSFITISASVLSFIGSYRLIYDLIVKLPREKLKIIWEKIKKHSLCIIIIIILFVFIVLLYGTYSSAR